MRILFVDDEENILQGLKRSLRDMRDQWDMHFSVGGENGLTEVSKKPFDVVVSDMRMPGMDGLQFLSKVRDLNPSAARFALSGYSEKESLIESTGICHQYLAKPCDLDLLKDKISRTLSLQNALHNDELQKVISQINNLPSSPVLYWKIREELENPEPETKRVAEIISQDASMTAKVLHLVNSAFFGIPRHVPNAEEATKMLGIQRIKRLVLSIEIFAAFDESELFNINIKSLWEHSFATGQLAKDIAIAERSDAVTVDQSMISGILHDIGKLVIATNFPDDCTFSTTVAEDSSSIEKKSQLGDIHAEVGAYLMGLWGLPNKIVEAVAFHHQPDQLVCDEFTPLTAVHAANALLHEFNSAENEVAENRRLNIVYLTQLGLDTRIPDWRKILKDSAERN